MTQFVGTMGLIAAAIGLAGCDGGEPAAPGAATNAAAPPPAQVDAQTIEKSLSAAAQYFNGGKLEKARAILAVLIDRAPGEVRARELNGQVLAMMAIRAGQEGRTVEAAQLMQQAYAEYQSAVELDPETAGLQHSAGMMAHEAGLYDEALAHFLEAGRLDPLNPQPSIFAAQILIRGDRLDDAEAQLALAMGIDEDQPMIHASLAVIALQRDQFDAAREHISVARMLDPADVGLLAQEARIHRRSGQPRRGLEMLVLLTDRQKAQEAVSVELAAGYEAIGEPARAAEVWVNRIRLGEDPANLGRDALRAAAAYLEAGRRDLARPWLEEARLRGIRPEEITTVEAEFGDS